jgi:hypothetical protein
MVFGPLARWLVEDGKARAREKGFDEGSTEREVAHLLAAYMQLSNKVVPDNSSLILGRKSLVGVELNNPGCLDLYRLPWYYGEGSNIAPNPNVRKAIVILFEIFQLEEVSMAANVEDTVNTYLVASPMNPVQEGKPVAVNCGISFTSFFDIAGLLPYVAPPFDPPILQFFSFILRKHFDLRLSDSAFEDGDIDLIDENSALESLSWPHLFCNGEAGWGIFEPYGSPRVSREDREDSD